MPVTFAYQWQYVYIALLDLKSVIFDGTSCANNGTCEESFDSFSCNCVDGYEGERCEIGRISL